MHLFPQSSPVAPPCAVGLSHSRGWGFWATMYRAISGFALCGSKGTVMTLDLSTSDIPRQIQANMMAYMRLFADLPGMVMHDDAEMFWFVSNRPAPGNN